MRSRRLTKRVDIYEISTSVDGFGGNTITETQVGSAWAEIRSLNPGGNFDSVGVLDINDSILVKLRKRNDITYSAEKHFIVYRGFKYTISTSPENIDLNDRWITFIAKREQTRSNVASTEISVYVDGVYEAGVYF